jgi:hypothetical protein
MNRIDPRLVKSIAILLNGNVRWIGTASIALYSEFACEKDPKAVTLLRLNAALRSSYSSFA